MKKKEEAKEEAKTVEVKEKIALLTLDLGREDLNALRDKINELARKLNA